MGRPPIPRTAQSPATVVGCTWLPLHNGMFALIDDVDADLAMFTWSAVKKRNIWYAWKCQRVGESRQLHGLIGLRMGIPRLAMIDHVNRNGLDCRRQNLRPATHSQNAANSGLSKRNESGFRGVSRGHSGTWQASIRVRGKSRALGFFANPATAARAYDAAAREAFGSYAHPNFDE